MDEDQEMPDVFRVTLNRCLENVRNEIARKTRQLEKAREATAIEEGILAGLVRAEADFVAGIAIIDAHRAATKP